MNPGEIAGNGIHDDGNGFIDEVNRWNFFLNTNNTRAAGNSARASFEEHLPLTAAAPNFEWRYTKDGFDFLTTIISFTTHPKGFDRVDPGVTRTTSVYHAD